MLGRLKTDLALPTFARPVQFDAKPKAIEAFDPMLQLAGDSENVVDVLGFIGPSIFDDVSLRSVTAQLRQAGDGDITVRVNSPGGDFFEGQAIYNALRAHKGRVLVQVMGIAASAASVIAMAGDDIEMAKTSWLMIHNVWSVVIGDRHVMQSAIDDMEKFDQVTADLYQARTGLKAADIRSMMDAETFLSGAEAIEKGFATKLMDREPSQSDQPGGQKKQANAIRTIEAALARQGFTRADRRQLFTEFAAARDAGGNGSAPGAASSQIDDATLVACMADLKQNSQPIHSRGS